MGVGEEGDCGAGIHNDMSTSTCNNNDKTCKITDMVSFINILFVILLPKSLIRLEKNKLTVIIR